MKKTIALIFLTSLFCIVPQTTAVYAEGKEMFLKRLKICSNYSYVYGYDGKKPLKRSVLGTSPVKTGLACIYKQELTKNRILECQFRVQTINEVIQYFNAGKESDLFSKALEDERCILK